MKRSSPPSRWVVDPAAPDSPVSRAAALFSALEATAPLAGPVRSRHLAALREGRVGGHGGAGRRSGVRLLAIALLFGGPAVFAAAGMEVPEIVLEAIQTFVRPGPPPAPPVAPKPSVKRPPHRAAPAVVQEEPEWGELEITSDSAWVEQGSPLPEGASALVPPPPPPQRLNPAPRAPPAEETPAPEPEEPGPRERLALLLDAGEAELAAEMLRDLEASGLLRPTEPEVLWGRVRTGQGDCRGALSLFTRALDSDGDPDLQQEALYRRAVCHAMLGDALSSHADIDLYLLRYPGGPHVGVLSHRYRR